jgi:Undecaprenyl-phosphate glucose phosphotransferase
MLSKSCYSATVGGQTIKAFNRDVVRRSFHNPQAMSVMSSEYRAALLGSVTDAERTVKSEGASRRSGPARLPFHLVERAVVLVELFIVVAASVLSGVGYHWIFLDAVGSIVTFLGVGLLVFVNFSAISAARRNYRPSELLNFRRQVRDVTLTWTFVCLMLLAVAFSLKITEGFSRGASITFFVIGWSAIVAWRGYASHFLARAMADGAFAERKILLLAEEDQLAKSTTLFELRRCGYKPVKIFKIKQSEIEASGIPSSLRATLDEIIKASRLEQIEDLYLLISWDHRRCIEDILTVLRVLPVPIHLMPDENVARFLTNRLVNVGAAWTAELRRAPLTPAEQVLKRAVDVIASGLGLVLLTPLLLVTALLIKLDSRGPVLFRQTRNGFNGRSFQIFKFRTMRVLEDGPDIQQATRNDPRVTHLGRWLRRASIDELPQLLNVLRGNMSLVGPRPHAAAHNNEYEKLIANYAFRYHVKPGITGWAQVNGYRGETQTVELMSRRVELDLWYINNWSIWLDVRILLKTLIFGLRQSGAY